MSQQNVYILQFKEMNNPQELAFRKYFSSKKKAKEFLENRLIKDRYEVARIELDGSSDGFWSVACYDDEGCYVALWNNSEYKKAGFPAFPAYIHRQPLNDA